MAGSVRRREEGAWRFDSSGGVEEIINRRVGTDQSWARFESCLTSNWMRVCQCCLGECRRQRDPALTAAWVISTDGRKEWVIFGDGRG